MEPAVLEGKFTDGSWRWEFWFVDSYANPWVCKGAGPEWAGEALEKLEHLVLSAIAEVVAARVSQNGLRVRPSAVEGLSGEFSLSIDRDGIPDEEKLAELQESVRNAFADFMDSHPEDAREIISQISTAARAAAAAQQARESIAAQTRRDTLEIPALPKRICWTMPEPDLRQMNLEGPVVAPPGQSPREALAADRRRLKALRQAADALVMKNFQVDHERAMELLEQKIGPLLRSIPLPDSISEEFLYLQFQLSRRWGWLLTLDYPVGLQPTPDHNGLAKNHASKELEKRIAQIPGLEQRYDGCRQAVLGPINDLETFRKAAWPVFVRVYNSLREISLSLAQ